MNHRVFAHHPKHETWHTRVAHVDRRMTIIHQKSHHMALVGPLLQGSKSGVNGSESPPAPALPAHRYLSPLWFMSVLLRG